ncbi:Hypothetical_protein [Hexamita inflata]|uniref:Hypothetical_protein n=1 Tax=Hexamita inflata TaxID=28002 RepID=A0AA86ULK5_9EUKA|nr:Hypothetical protein HINF_LOCUS37759 [Hexamita inflata]CAI9956067.1 Hypothetical protein HINF_LOCUS43712 [Hexamita inflata]
MNLNNQQQMKDYTDAFSSVIKEYVIDPLAIATNIQPDQDFTIPLTSQNDSQVLTASDYNAQINKIRDFNIPFATTSFDFMCSVYSDSSNFYLEILDMNYKDITCFKRHFKKSDINRTTLFGIICALHKIPKTQAKCSILFVLSNENVANSLLRIQKCDINGINNIDLLVPILQFKQYQFGYRFKYCDRFDSRFKTRIQLKFPRFCHIYYDLGFKQAHKLESKNEIVDLESEKSATENTEQVQQIEEEQEIDVQPQKAANQPENNSQSNQNQIEILSNQSGSFQKPQSQNIVQNSQLSQLTTSQPIVKYARNPTEWKMIRMKRIIRSWHKNVYNRMLMLEQVDTKIEDKVEVYDKIQPIAEQYIQPEYNNEPNNIKEEEFIQFNANIPDQLKQDQENQLESSKQESDQQNTIDSSSEIEEQNNYEHSSEKEIEEEVVNISSVIEISDEPLLTKVFDFKNINFEESKTIRRILMEMDVQFVLRRE